MMQRTIFATLLLALVLPASAFAYSFTPTSYDTLAGLTATFTGGSASIKTVDGSYLSLGVSGGVGGEVSIGQSITLSFDNTQIIQSLDLVALFADGNHGDVGDEVASITALSGGQATTYTLTSGINSAVWTGLGTASGLNPNAGVQGNGGVWQVVNPFGDLAVDSIVFTALDNGMASGVGGKNSDFGIGGMTTTAATPIPAAAWLLGSGLVGLIGLRRKQQ